MVTASSDGTARIWDTPVVPLPMPAWLSELAEALAGQRLTAHGLTQSLTGDELLDLKQRLLESAEPNFYTRWGKWFFGQRTSLAVSSPSAAPVADR